MNKRSLLHDHFYELQDKELNEAWVEFLTDYYQNKVDLYFYNSKETILLVAFLLNLVLTAILTFKFF